MMTNYETRDTLNNNNTTFGHNSIQSTGKFLENNQMS